jgi:hypothetical protein
MNYELVTWPGSTPEQSFISGYGKVKSHIYPWNTCDSCVDWLCTAHYLAPSVICLIKAQVFLWGCIQCLPPFALPMIPPCTGSKDCCSCCHIEDGADGTMFTLPQDTKLNICETEKCTGKISNTMHFVSCIQFYSYLICDCSKVWPNFAVGHIMTLSHLDYMASNFRTTQQMMNWKGYENKWLWSNQATILAFVWREWGKPWKISVLAEIWTQYLPNTSLEHYCYINLFSVT